MPAPMTEEKFWARVDRSGGTDACWPWTGRFYPNHYGIVGWRRRAWRAHRLAWELMRSPIPPGLVVDHLCRNRACCNPRHMRVVTIATNVTENSTSPSARNKLKTHCDHGHALSGANLALESASDGRVFRRCRTCALQRKAEWRARATARPTHSEGASQ